MPYRTIDCVSKRVNREKEKTVSSIKPSERSIKGLTLKLRIKKQHLQKIASAYLMMLMVFQSMAGVFMWVPKGNEAKALGDFDTSSQPITGNIYFASQLPNGNLLYAAARGSKVGVEELDPSTNTVVFSWQDPTWTAGNGPESIYRYSNGNYLISDVDAQKATYEMRPDHTKVWSYTSFYTCDARPVIIDGVDAVILFARDFSHITIIRRDNQEVIWDMGEFNYVNNGDFRVIDGQKYILAADYKDHKLYKINYDTKQIVWSYTVPNAQYGPYSAEWIDDNRVLFSLGSPVNTSEIINTDNNNILWASKFFTGTTVGSKLTPDGLQVITADSSPIIKFSSLPSLYPVAAGNIPQSGIKLSVVAGVAFADFSASEALSPYIGYKLVITDSGGKNLIGYIKAAGVEETLGGEKHTITGVTSDPNGNEMDSIANWYNTSYSTFESSSADKSTGNYSLHVAGSGEALSKLGTPTIVGGLYKTIFDIKAISAGTAWVSVIDGNGSGIKRIIASGAIPAAWTTYSSYYTTNYGMMYGGIDILSGSSEIYVDNLSVKQVLTPGPTGVTITSTSDGSIYNWASQDSGFNLRDAGYTYAIYPGSYAMTISDTNTHSYQLVDCNNTPGQAGVDVTGAAILQNFTVVRCPAGAFQFEQNATLVNSIGISSGEDIAIAVEKTVNGSHNIFSDLDKSGVGTYLDEGSTATWSGNPLFVSSSNFNLQSTSSLIDSGVAISGITADYVGNPIYGNPDIGAYEYQPSYSITTDNPNISGVVRMYSDGKYRYIDVPSGSATAKLAVIPSSDSVDITINTWNTTTDYYKKWTEDSNNHNITTNHTIGDLTPNASYILKIDGQEAGIYDSNNNGQITFTYQGGYSQHTFEIEQKPSTAFIPPTKPQTGNISITNNTTDSLSLNNLPTNITQIAISTNKDFTNVSWEDITKKEELLKQYINQKEIYIKLRTDTGAVSDTITYTPQTSNTDTTNHDTTNTLQDGDIVKTPNNPDIYVIKIQNSKKYKRLILSPHVFNSYQHLKWDNIKTISEEQLNQYQTSSLIQEATDTIIYALTSQGDQGQRKPFDITQTYDPDSIYTINKVDRDSYEWEE